MEYEFSATENQTIDKTGGRAILYGYISIVVGIVGILASIGVGVAFGGGAILFGVGLAGACLPTLAAGFWYVQAGQALKGVVATNGDDISLMMVALSRVASAFRLEGIATIVALVLGIVLGFALVAHR